MRTFNPNKLVTIVIHAPIHPAGGYTIYDISGKPINNRVVTRRADESDIQDILTEKQFADFEENGKYTFKVQASLLTDKFQYLYR